MKVGVVCNPAKVEDLEVLRTEIKLRWPLDELVWLETTVDDPGAGQTRAALRQGADLVLVCGGDGTVAECAGVLAGTAVPMALIPLGTGNLLVRNLGLPLELTDALDVAAGKERDCIDILESGDKRFSVMAGLGFDASMMRHTNDVAKERLGWLAYVAGGSRALRRARSWRCAIEVDNAVRMRVRALSILVANVGQLQGGMTVVREADPRDGLLDVIVLMPRTWRDIVALLMRLLRHRLDESPRARLFAGRTVAVHLDEPVSVEFDGDYAGEVTTLTVSVLPKAVVLCAQ